jgi:hypothetical protein
MILFSLGFASSPIYTARPLYGELGCGLDQGHFLGGGCATYLSYPNQVWQGRPYRLALRPERVLFS